MEDEWDDNLVEISEKAELLYGEIKDFFIEINETPEGRKIFFKHRRTPLILEQTAKRLKRASLLIKQFTQIG